MVASNFVERGRGAEVTAQEVDDAFVADLTGEGLR